MSKRTPLLISAFHSGLAVMAFEITGSRVMAPFTGTSTYVWTAIIGTILLAMSAGYVFGGHISSLYSGHRHVAHLFLGAGGAILLMNAAKNTVMTLVQALGMPLLAEATTSALLLFALPAFLLAAVFPLVMHILMNGTQKAGKLAGYVYALSTLGSLCGTFGAAVVFIPALGTDAILWTLGGALMANAVWLLRGKTRITAAVAGLLLAGGSGGYVLRARTVVDMDSPYHRILVVDGKAGGRPVRTLQLNGHVNSGIYLDKQDDPLFAYTSAIRLAGHAVPELRRMLLNGAGAFSMVRTHRQLFPSAAMQVVEIDPRLSDVAAQYFSFSRDEMVTVTHTDGRVFLNTDTAVFDAIFCDVFTSPLDVPFHLSTREAYALMRTRLDPEGVLMVNVLGSLNGPGSAFLSSQIATVKAVFGNVDLIRIEGSSPHHIKNNIVIATKSGRPLKPLSDDAETTALLRQRVKQYPNTGMVLEDNYAPVEWLLWQ